VPMILAVLLATSLVAAQSIADPTPIALCQRVHGFAGEPSAAYLLTPPANLPLNTPIALSFRLLNVATDMSVAIQGQETIVVAGDIVRLVTSSQPFTITVLKGSKLDLAPFELTTYVPDGGSVCTIPVSENNPFRGPLPPGQVWTMVFKAAMPSAARSAYQVSLSMPPGTSGISGILTHDPAATMAAPPADAVSLGLTTVSGVWPTSPSLEMYILVRWTAGPTVPTPSPEFRLAVIWLPTDQASTDAQPSAPSTAQRIEADAETAGVSLLSILFWGTLLYFVVRSAINYRSGITTFPEFVPHYEMFIQCFKCCSDAASNARQRTATEMRDYPASHAASGGGGGGGSSSGGFTSGGFSGIVGTVVGHASSEASGRRGYDQVPGDMA